MGFLLLKREVNLSVRDCKLRRGFVFCKYPCHKYLFLGKKLQLFHIRCRAKVGQVNQKNKILVFNRLNTNFVIWHWKFRLF